MGSASSDQSLALFSVNVARDSNYQRGISPGGSEQVQTHASQLHPGLCNDFADCSAVWILPAPSWERKKKKFHSKTWIVWSIHRLHVYYEGGK